MTLLDTIWIGLMFLLICFAIDSQAYKTRKEIKLLQEIVALDYDRSCDYIVSK